MGYPCAMPPALSSGLLHRPETLERLNMDALLSGIVQEDGESPSPALQQTRMWFSKSMAGQVLEDWIQEGQRPTGVQIEL